MARISQQQLESYLWGAAVLLRGTIDAGDYKQFIFPLLFYKRLCDVFDEETQTALEESGGDRKFAAYAENHRFQIPPEAHWCEIRQTSKNIGHVLQSAMRAIETANPDKLYGIFGDQQWTNKDRLSDAMLRDLVEHFSSLELTVANLPEDELGIGYEYLIKKFADDSGHTAAEFYTNRTVVHLMTEMLEPQPGESIYDPTCGSGGMLLSCIAHLRRQKKEWRNVKLYGQERNLMTSSIARMNCFLHGIEDFQIVRGDTLSEPKLVQGDHLMRFDVVLANPPYSIKQWDRDAFASDPWGRNLYGTPPQGRADYAFWQHILCSLAPKTGRCAILFPHGVLFRQEETEMRHKLIEADLIECVLGLGPNLFYNSSMQSCVVVCRMNKPKVRRGKILFIDAVTEVTRERAQSFLTDDNIERIVSIYRDFKDEPCLARVVGLEEIRKNGDSLNIPLYVQVEHQGTDTAASDLSRLGSAFQGWASSAYEVRKAISSIIGGEVSNASFAQLRKATSKMPKWLDRSKWRKVSLGTVAEEISERADDPAASGVERFVGLEHFDAGEIKIRRWGPTENLVSAMKRFSAGDTLFARRNAYLKRASMADFDGLCSGDAIVLREKDGEMVPGFLPFILNTDKFWTFAIANAAGTMSRRVNVKTLLRYEFDLPPLDLQRRIAEILWAVDEAAQSSRILAEQIQRVANATAQSAVFPFGYSPNRRNLDERYSNSFRALLADQLYEVFSGNGEPEADEAGDALFFKVNDFNLNSDETALTTGATRFFRKNNSAIRLLPAGTVVFPKRGASIFLNKVGIVRQGVALDPNVMGLIPKSENVSSDYLYWLIKLTEIGRIADTTSLPQVNHKHLTHLVFPVPPLERQQEFIERIGQIRHAGAAVKRQLDSLGHLAQQLTNTITML